MINELRLIIEEIQQGKHLEAYAALLLTILVIILDVANIASQAVVSAMIILLLGSVLYSLIQLRRELRATRQQLGTRHIWRFFPDRQKLPSIPETFAPARHEVLVVGVQLGLVSHTYLQLVQSKAASGCQMKLALLSPVDRNGNSQAWIDEMGVVHAFPNLKETLRANLNRLRAWLRELPDELRSKIEIRIYFDIPTASAILVDADSPWGLVHVEPILYRVNPQDRPSFRLRAIDDRQLFERIRDAYLQLWESSTDIESLDF